MFQKVFEGAQVSHSIVHSVVVVVESVDLVVQIFDCILVVLNRNVQVFDDRALRESDVVPHIKRVVTRGCNCCSCSASPYLLARCLSIQ
ncbi:MAG: hypothetical protein M2R46_03133 [Verrucomicrobia subdivision 3 bacterium]|nr:hypothetical protein [Limisphaerales bacterium]